MKNSIKNMNKISKINNHLNTIDTIFEGTVNNEWYKFNITIDNEIIPTTTKYNFCNYSEQSCDSIEFNTIEDFKKEFELYVDFNNIEYYQNNLKRMTLVVTFIRMFLNGEI